MLVAGESDDSAERRDRRAKLSLVLTAIFVCLISLDVILALVALH
jgi:hypothetical protein